MIDLGMRFLGDEILNILVEFIVKEEGITALQDQSMNNSKSTK